MTRGDIRAHEQRPRPWQCAAAQYIEQFPDNLGLNHHQCQLAKDHYGWHMCWCGTAFDGSGNFFEHTRLTIKEDDDGSTWLSPDWTPDAPRH